VQAKPQRANTPAHDAHSPVLQFVFSHCALHEALGPLYGSQWQQNMLHGPLPQQPKLALRLQQYASADVGWKNATIITASIITVKYGPDLLIIVCM